MDKGAAAIKDIQGLINERSKDTSPACGTWNNKHLVAAISVLEQAERWERLIEAAGKVHKQLCIDYMKLAREEPSMAKDEILAVLSALPEPKRGQRCGI